MISGYSNLPKWISELIDNNIDQLFKTGAVDVENVKGAYSETVDIIGDNPKMPILSKISIEDVGSFTLSWAVLNHKETESEAANIAFFSRLYYVNIPIGILVTIVRDPYPIAIRLVMGQEGV